MKIINFMNNKIILIFLSIFLISFISANQICEVYDDFSSGVLDTSMWEIRQDYEGQPLIADSSLDITEQNFHTAQDSIIGDHRTYLVPTQKFKAGDIFEFDLDFISANGNSMVMLLIDNQNRIGLGGCWDGTCQPFQTYHIKLEFKEGVIKITHDLWSDEVSINSNSEHEIYIGTVFGHNGIGHIDYDNFKLCKEITIEERVSILETWKQIIEDWKISIINSLAVLTSKVLELTEKINNHEERITALENSSAIEDLTPNYWKYLSANERKNIVCGYAEDNHLTDIEDLGWSCRLTYKNNRWNKEIANCKCKKFN